MKTMEMWWWWREHQGNGVSVVRKQYKCGVGVGRKQLKCDVCGGGGTVKTMKMWCPCGGCGVNTINTESTRKLSIFNFQGTKTLYQNNLKNIAFFLTFLKG